MNWMRVSQLPVMQALREVSARKPIPLFGPAAKPRSPRNAGRRGGSARKAIAFAKSVSWAIVRRDA